MSQPQSQKNQLLRGQEKLQEIASRVNGVHRKIANDALPNVNRVYCRVCGSSEPVDAAYCLAHGWPRCCGATMTIDKLKEDNG